MLPKNDLNAITPATYNYVPLCIFDAVTVWSRRTGYVSINRPQGIYYRSNGGMTVRGTQGTGTTFRSADHDTEANITSVVFQGVTYTHDETLFFELEAFRAVLRLRKALGL